MPAAALQAHAGALPGGAQRAAAPHGLPHRGRPGHLSLHAPGSCRELKQLVLAPSTLAVLHESPHHHRVGVVWLLPGWHQQPVLGLQSAGGLEEQAAPDRLPWCGCKGHIGSHGCWRNTSSLAANMLSCA